MLQKLKIILLFLFLSGTGLAAPKIPILMYHHIRQPQSTDVRELRELSCAPETFIRHLEALQKADYQFITFEDVAAGRITTKSVIITIDDGYQDAYTAYQILRQRKLKAVFFVTTKYLGDNRHLSTAQLKEMARRDMEIGSHSVSHADLTALSPERCQKEIQESKQFLENLLDKKIISFCYPAGRQNAGVRRLVKDSGYLYARTTRPGFGKIDTETYTLRTFRVDDTTDAEELVRRINYSQK